MVDRRFRKTALLSLGGLAWTVLAVWLGVHASIGKGPVTQLAIQVGIAVVAFAVPAIVVNRWYLLRSKGTD